MEVVIKRFEFNQETVEELNKFLAKWKELTPERHIVHITAHMRGECSIFYTFFYTT